MLPRLLVFLLLLATAGPVQAEPRSGSKLILHTLLTSENPNFVLMGAKVVERDPAADPFTLDLVAELLDQRTRAHVATGKDLDTAAWLIRALGASKKVRYRAVIENAVTIYAHEKVSTFGKLSLEQLVVPSDSAYRTGDISVDDLRKELESERSALTRSDGDITVIKPADSLDSVIAIMGYPDQLLETVHSKGHLYVKVRVRSLQLHYPGRGFVDIDNHFASDFGWTVSTVWPHIPSKSEPYSGPNPDDAALIMTTQPMALRKLARRLVSRRVSDTQLLDRVAERVQILANPGDEYELDALVYLCRLLGASGNNKYIDALNAVSAGGESLGLRQQARFAREKLGVL